MSSLKDRLNAIREAEAAERAAKEAERLAIAAKREQMATVLSRRFPGIEEYLRKANADIKDAFGDSCGLSHEVVVNDGGFAKLQITPICEKARGHSSCVINLTEGGARFDDIVVSPREDMQELFDALDDSLVGFFADHHARRARRREF